MKSLLLVPDGVGIRNFLCGRFIDLLTQDGEVVVWHGTPEPELPRCRNSAVQWLPLATFREGVPERILRRAKVYGQLYGRREPASEAMLRWLRPAGRPVTRLIGRTAQLAGWVFSSPRGLAALERFHAEATERSGYMRDFEKVLAGQQPDVVFCTHQRASRAVPAMLAARRLGIPTATFIYSWDNLPKGRMAVHADHFLVWSEWMKEEMLHYYSEVSPDRVHIVGTPQFEHYFNPSLVRPREVFLRSLGLDPGRPVVCFSGSDLSTSPYDPAYLSDVAEALRRFPPQDRPQILFRPCPADTSGRFRGTLDEYPEIVLSEPLWFSHGEGDWTQIIPSMEDVSLLVNVVRHCDLVVNLGSTMAMDFAILEKPGIYLAYNQKNAAADQVWNVDDIYRLPHFRSVHELDPVYWARSPQDLRPLMARALAEPWEKSRARRAWLTRQAMHPLDGASERCRQALRTIAAVPSQVSTMFS